MEGHTATLVGTKMYVFGGTGGSTYYNELYAYDITIVDFSI
jgi:N-acetylneuraminic acid mutarotase